MPCEAELHDSEKAANQTNDLPSRFLDRNAAGIEEKTWRIKEFGRYRVGTEESITGLELK